MRESAKNVNGISGRLCRKRGQWHLLWNEQKNLKRRVRRGRREEFKSFLFLRALCTANSKNSRSIRKFLGAEAPCSIVVLGCGRHHDSGNRKEVGKKCGVKNDDDVQWPLFFTPDLLPTILWQKDEDEKE